MSNAEQLARIASVRPEPTVKIRKLDKGISIFFWLCDPCLKEKQAKGWTLMETRSPPHKLECDECRAKRGLLR